MFIKSSTALAALSLALGLAPTAFAGSVEKVLYTFPSGGGVQPNSGVARDAVGNLYGTTEFSGDGHGIVYELVRNGAANWTYRVIHTFDGNDGAFPVGQLTFDSAGNLYGTTVGGTAFEMSPDQDGNWSITRNYYFAGATEGSAPRSGVVLDAAGNAYGTLSQGALGYGAIYKLTPSGDGGWQETTIYKFTNGTDGAYPGTNLTLDRKGNVYGTVQYGGTNSSGYVFKFHPTKTGWKKTVLYNFGDGDAGGLPYDSLTLDKAGNLYGTLQSPNATGSAFELTKPSQAKLSTQQDWAVTTLYRFKDAADGGVPGGLTFDKQGNLYGPAALGGANGQGAIFKLTPSTDNGQTTWTESVLYDFTGGNDGCLPGWNLLVDQTVSGRIYGTTGTCGANQNGVVYSVKK